MDLGIMGKAALVAGSSAGMGKEAARALAREGARLVMSARGEERLLAAAQEIRMETGADIATVAADHGTVAGRQALQAACGKPDILVATCAPPRITETYLAIEPEEWIDALSATLVGPVELIRAFSGGMADRGFGRIVMIGTGAAKNPAEIRLLSGPARAALCNYTVAVAKGLIARNVTINNILPGMFHTATIRERFEAMASERGTSYEAETQRFAEEWRIPAKRFGDPADVGAFVAMLCSRYGSFISGQSLVIDGALTNAVF